MFFGSGEPIGEHKFQEPVYCTLSRYWKEGYIPSFSAKGIRSDPQLTAAGLLFYEKPEPCLHERVDLNKTKNARRTFDLMPLKLPLRGIMSEANNPSFNLFLSGSLTYPFKD
jgi:hypothetical protein